MYVYIFFSEHARGVGRHYLRGRWHRRTHRLRPPPACHSYGSSRLYCAHGFGRSPNYRLASMPANLLWPASNTHSKSGSRIFSVFHFYIHNRKSVLYVDIVAGRADTIVSKYIITFYAVPSTTRISFLEITVFFVSFYQIRVFGLNLYTEYAGLPKIL